MIRFSYSNKDIKEEEEEEGLMAAWSHRLGAAPRAERQVPSEHPSSRLFRNHSRKVSSHHVGSGRKFRGVDFPTPDSEENVGDRGLLNGSQQRRSMSWKYNEVENSHLLQGRSSLSLRKVWLLNVASA
jgi:hypothetical protein